MLTRSSMVQPKKTKAPEARFHIQPCGEQASQWIHICRVGRRLDHQLLACPYLVEQQTLVWPKQPLAVAGWQWAKWTSSWFVQVTCDLTNQGGNYPLVELFYLLATRNSDTVWKKHKLTSSTHRDILVKLGTWHCIRLGYLRRSLVTPFTSGWLLLQLHVLQVGIPDALGLAHSGKPALPPDPMCQFATANHLSPFKVAWGSLLRPLETLLGSVQMLEQPRLSCLPARLCTECCITRIASIALEYPDLADLLQELHPHENTKIFGNCVTGNGACSKLLTGRCQNSRTTSLSWP